MAHNPVIGRYAINVTDSFVIHENQVGLLYKNHVFDRALPPGGSPNLKEKALSKIKGQEVAVYVVDLKPHDFEWRVNLPARDEGDLFNTTIRLTYRVVEPERMVKESITDTELTITRYLEGELRKIAREIPLNKHTKADSEFTHFVNNLANPSKYCGLELVSIADVQIYLSSEQKKRVLELDTIGRRMDVEQSYEFKDELPSKENEYRFEIQVQVTYSVVDKARLTSVNLDEVVANLKPRIMSQLRRVSRRYTITELAQAEEAMQEKMEDILGELSLFGLQLHYIAITSDLNEEMRKRYVEILEQKHKSLMKKYEMEGVKDTAQVVIDLARSGNMNVLAMAVSRNEISMEELFQHLTTQQREQFDLQMQVLDKFTSKDLLREDIFYDQAGRVAKVAADSVTGIAVSGAPELPRGADKKALPNSSQEPPENQA
ncbi:MAG: SPFH domain-containing protein [Anaerolineales bacterium]|jgi:hypothetical protein|nr:SPFH domain-containing protein [Anaerolineales bacterium]